MPNEFDPILDCMMFLNCNDDAKKEQYIFKLKQLYDELQQEKEQMQYEITTMNDTIKNFKKENQELQNKLFLQVQLISQLQLELKETENSLRSANLKIMELEKENIKLLDLKKHYCNHCTIVEGLEKENDEIYNKKKEEFCNGCNTNDIIKQGQKERLELIHKKCTDCIIVQELKKENNGLKDYYNSATDRVIEFDGIIQELRKKIDVLECEKIQLEKENNELKEKIDYIEYCEIEDEEGRPELDPTDLD